MASWSFLTSHQPPATSPGAGVHRALLLAAITGALLMAAAGPARVTQLRQIMRHALRKARAG